MSNGSNGGAVGDGVTICVRTNPFLRPVVTSL